jgi:uncharacterized membrane protein (DUF485 family)
MKPKRDWIKLPGRARPRTFGENTAPYINLDELELDEDTFDADADEQLQLALGSDDTLKEVAEQTTYGAVFLDDLLKRQRALSISVAIAFLVIIFSLPLLTFVLRPLPPLQIFGFALNWLFLGILIYPVIWALAFYFVSTADKYEDEFTTLVK